MSIVMVLTLVNILPGVSVGSVRDSPPPQHQRSHQRHREVGGSRRHLALPPQLQRSPADLRSVHQQCCLQAQENLGESVQNGNDEEFNLHFSHLTKIVFSYWLNCYLKFWKDFDTKLFFKPVKNNNLVSNINNMKLVTNLLIYKITCIHLKYTNARLNIVVWFFYVNVKCKLTKNVFVFRQNRP